MLPGRVSWEPDAGLDRRRQPDCSQLTRPHSPLPWLLSGLTPDAQSHGALSGPVSPQVPLEDAVEEEGVKDMAW